MIIYWMKIWKNINLNLAVTQKRENKINGLIGLTVLIWNSIACHQHEQTVLVNNKLEPTGYYFSLNNKIFWSNFLQKQFSPIQKYVSGS